MAGDTSFAVNAIEMSSAVPVTDNSDIPQCLNTKKKGQIKSTEMSSKKENKKSKPKPIGNEGKVKSDSVEPIDMAPIGSLLTARPDEDIQQQTKHSTKKSQKRESGIPRALGEDLACTQAAEKELSKSKLFKKSPGIQKSRSRITLDEEKFASGTIQEPLIQTGEAPGQLIKKTSTKKRQAKEGSAKLSVSSWVDSSMDDVQSIPQEVNDKVKLVIEKHRVRVLRKGGDSSVQNIPLNEAASGNQKMGHQSVKMSTHANIPLATEKQIMTGTENGVLGPELEGNTWAGKTGNAVTTVKGSDACVLNTYRTVASVPVQLVAEVKSMMDKSQLSVISHEESLVYNNPKSNPSPSFTEIFQRRDNVEICQCDLTSLENDIAFNSGIIVITRGNSSEISLKPPSAHMLEMTAVQRLSSPNRGFEPGALGLEWFPELYPNYQNLFSRKQKQQDTRIPKTQVILSHENWQGKNASLSVTDF